MKYAIILLFTITSAASAQDNVLFKIITLSYGVNIDGGAIAVGDDVTAASKMISIPADGYLGVVTADGYVHELKNSIAVADVNAFVKIREVRIPTGATTRAIPTELYVPLWPRGRKLFGDSTFLVWDERRDTDRVTGIEYDIKVLSRTEELDEFSIGHNWMLIDMKPYLEISDGVFVTVVSKKTKSYTDFVILKKKDDHKKLLTDLERLANLDDLAMLCAIFDVNDYDYDRNFIAYKILSRKYKPTGVLSTYFGVLTRDVDMR